MPIADWKTAVSECNAREKSMEKEAIPEVEKGFLFYSLYFIGSVVINLLCVSLHEVGHAIVYLLQGYKVAFHFTKADPIDGTETVLGASAGLAVNILFALFFLFLLVKYKSIVFYTIIAANTLFSRLIIGILMMLRGGAFEDETFIGTSIGMSPLLLEVLVLVLLAGIFVIATRTLIIQHSKKYSKYIIILTIIACIVSLAVVAPLDAKGV